MKKIAIIPARSGSKGLKDKNIIDLCGKPLLAYSIDAALQSQCFEKVIVSTDSAKYGAIAERYGASVLYRGERLSNDTATTYDVLADLLQRILWDFSYFVLLQPTSPLRQAVHVCEALALFEKQFDSFDFLVSVKEAEHAKVLVNPLDDRGGLSCFDTDFSRYKRQNYKEYTPNGAIFMAKPAAYMKQKHFFGAKSLAYVMNKVDSIDIDDRLDYEFASLVMEKRMKGEV